MRLGEKHTNSNGEQMRIIVYNSSIDCTIEFEDGTILERVTYNNVKKGSIKNPNSPSVFGVGYLGVGKYNKKSYPFVYNIWQSILQRCYDKNLHIRKPTYKECSITKEWCNFQIFAEWHEKNYKEDFHLDKDILFKGNKLYSPETCCFVPHEINIVFSSCNTGNYPRGICKKWNKYIVRASKYGIRLEIGSFHILDEAIQAFKQYREAYIKELADKWKDKIEDKVYKILINYKDED